MATVPAKSMVLQILDNSHRETMQTVAALQQRARVMEARALAAEERLMWVTPTPANGNQSCAPTAPDAGRLQQLMQENERLHAQLASTRLQLSDVDRSATQLKCRITELETQLERAARNEAASQAQRKQDQLQIKSLRASIRALEKELIQSASGYR